jgi:hypothetical protein
MPNMPSERSRRRPPAREFPEIPTAGEMPFGFLPRPMRATAIVSPRSPYWAWAESCPSRHPMAKPGAWSDTAFLVPRFDEAQMASYIVHSWVPMKNTTPMQRA